ncbi:cupin domain-containing protein [Labrenzia sp. PHM005]|uniref:cupin domain-containing protein n=1 Tax=Labrenzia sp. PHM005 TaxID=2590016 RepID=UPI00113FE4C1|nr:cupin domain-containing protein [Labrenzia sp. PHM005]QDG75522.1 cupin domain-containing protein [Labrenzia sp. PHM005]
MSESEEREDAPKPLHITPSSIQTFEIPDFITFRILLSGNQTDGTLAIFEDDVHPGQGPARHIHRDQDETFFFLEGEFDVEIAGERHHMKPGDVGFVPRGTVHAFKNVGSTVGKLRYILSPAGTFEEFIPSIHAILTDGTQSQDAIAGLAGKHGMEMVGPPLE